MTAPAGATETAAAHGRVAASSLQAPSAVVMIRPHHFFVNPQTAADNVFQTEAGGGRDDAVARSAHEQVTALARALESHGVRVHLFEDERHDRPDSVFPNNWFSTHRGGRIVVYPMCTPNRRGERRSDVLDLLKERYRVQDVIDYSGLEPDGLFLEGTGAMVLDHIARVAYVARSDRADPIVLERFCTHLGFEPMAFDASDEHGAAIYHTNVVMCVATDFALIGLDAMSNDARRAEIVDRLEQTGRSVVALTHHQVREFAGNAFELSGARGRLLAMSRRGRAALTASQLDTIEASCEIVDVDVSTIELAGGSVRCMLAGVHLDPRSTA